MKALIKYHKMDVETFIPRNDLYLKLGREEKPVITKADLAPLHYEVVEVVDIEWAAEDFEAVYMMMNTLEIPKGHPKRKVFESVKHTSMSIGDIIEFENGQIVVVADFGFEMVSED